MRRQVCLVLLVAGMTTGCGTPVDAIDPGADAPGDPAAPTGAAGRCMPVEAGPAPVRRLTRREYNNTIRDLLGNSTSPARGFQADGDLEGFANNANETVSVALATDYMVTAEALAATAVMKLDALLPAGCKDESEAACAGHFISVFGKRAFRRPLEADEAAALTAVYDSARASGGSFADGVRLVISAMLQSPSFLLHVERGVPGAATPAVPLTDYEIASRLSYVFWQSMPDPALMAAADQGKLRTAAGVEAEARRMLMDHRSRDGILNFYEEWLGLQLLGTNDMGTAMRREARTFIEHVIWSDDGRVATLLSAPYSFLNADLAKLYRLGGVTTTTFQKIDLNPTQRAGLLTQAAFLASPIRAVGGASEPIHRGLFVRERLLCNHIPPPGGAVVSMVMPPPEDPQQTTRQRFEVFFANPFCTGCHRLINPLGLGMENYDGSGRYRTTENGLPIDARGTITGAEEPMDFDGLAGPGGMATKLARSTHVQGCLAKQWLLYATGSVDFEGENCATKALMADFADTSGNLRELLVAVVKTDTFRFRPVLVSEACQ